jgi:hypothetical protein
MMILGDRESPDIRRHEMTDTWQDIQQNVTPGMPTRVRWFVMLGQTLEEIEAAYIMGQIDRDEYEAQLRDLDAKLGILGLSLANKPWLKAASRV